MTILDAIEDKKLFGLWFKGDSWETWKVFLRALVGLPMTAEQLRVFQDMTARENAPEAQSKEAYIICGRRSGKSFISSVIAVYLACFYDYSNYLAQGETGVIMLIAQDRRQARVLMKYISALINGIPLLQSMVAHETQESIALSSGIVIEVHTCNFRAVRGYTVIAAFCDEVAYWRSEDSASPDYEVINALRPSMATIPNSMLIALSSPYSRRGVLYDAYKKYHGQPGDILVWQADTRSMNPTVSQGIIDRAYDDDASVAQSEYGAQFRSDLESYISREVVEAAVIPNRYELPPIQGVVYEAFTDPSGGRADSFTLAIAHNEGETRILDLVRERKPPFSPEAVVSEFADILKSYNIHRVQGDLYAGAWPREQFQKHGIHYEASAKPKSDLYLELLPLLNSGRVELLDNQRLLNQLCSLERRTGRSGKDSVDHGPRGHDDVCNAVAGALVMLSTGAQADIEGFGRTATAGLQYDSQHTDPEDDPNFTSQPTWEEVRHNRPDLLDLDENIEAFKGVSTGGDDYW